MPKSATITGRTSSITNAFVNAIVPRVVPKRGEIQTALRILGMDCGIAVCSYFGHTASDRKGMLSRVSGSLDQRGSPAISAD